nr:MAG TPA: hypothetical protein [Caudoviricetes sp.]
MPGVAKPTLTPSAHKCYFLSFLPFTDIRN